MFWLADMAVTIVCGIWFFDLLPANAPLAWAVALVGAFFLMTMFDEIYKHFTGEHAF